MEIKPYLMLFAALCGALLLFGCTNSGGSAAPSAPSSPSNAKAPVYVTDEQVRAATNPTPSAPSSPSTAPAPSDMKGKCSIALKQDSITLGESVDASVSAFTGSGETATFMCGDKLRTLGTNGFFKLDILCDFAKPGTYDMWVKINGQACASKTVTVNSPAAPAPSVGTCSILSSKKNAVSSSDIIYDIAVKYGGFSSADKLIWNCGPTTFNKGLGGNTFGTSNPVGGTMNVQCEYVGSLAIENIPKTIKIKITDTACGEVST